MNRMSLYTLGVASAFAFTSAAVAQGTDSSAAAAPAAAAAAAAAAPTSTDAASAKPFSFGVLAGATIPTGDLSKVSGTGWNAGAFIGLNPASLPVSFRVEGVYHELGSKTVAGTKFQPKITAGTFDALWNVPMTGAIKPYLIAGVGVYHTSSDSSSTNFGINGGAGIDMSLSGFSVFVEARYHDIFTSGKSSQMIPISVGLKF